MGILFEKLTEYGNSDFYPYHMPGHKRQAMQGFSRHITDLDITEITGFDNLHQPRGILLEAQERAAAAFGAEESFFLVNGSTGGILSAVSAAVPFGGHLLISRNCHKSVYHAAYLRQLQLSYIYPSVMPKFDICEAVTAKQVEAQLQKDASIQAVLIVSPTYEGRIADIKAIAEVVHTKGIPLIVDEAHGAHLGFCKGFAPNSSRLGADLVINSVHKTLPAMTQTALLHCNGSLINRDLLKRYLHIYQSSSPSYIIMASIDHAVQAAKEGAKVFQQFRGYWTEMLQQLMGLQKIKILPDPQETEILPEPEETTAVHDIGKLVISTKGTGISGNQLAIILRENYHLEMEMACETYVLAMFTIADTWVGYERLIRALMEIDSELAELPTDGQSSGRCPTEALSNAWPNVGTESKSPGLPFYQAWDYKKALVSLDKAEGCLAGEFINLYPPGTPIAVPGEVMSRSVIRRIKSCLSSGLEVQGVQQQARSEGKTGDFKAAMSQEVSLGGFSTQTGQEYFISILSEENGNTL